MPTRRLQDIAIRYQVFLERLKEGEVREFGKVFDKITKATTDVLGALQAENIGKATRKELNSILAELRAQNTRLLNEATDPMFGRLETLAGDAADFEAKSVESVAEKLKGKLKVPTEAQAYAFAKAQPISATGQLLERFVSDWTQGEVTRLNNTVQRAWGEGWTNNELTRAIRGTKAANFKDGIIATSRRNASAIGRTAIQHTATQGRMATMEANNDVIVGYQWVSTLDSKTTTLCKGLDGRKFYFKDGGSIRPPAHINCRSTIISLLDPALGLDFLQKGATRSSEFGPVDAKTTYYDWLKQQPFDFQKEALGATRAKLFADGGLSTEKFAALNLGRNFQPLTLVEMRKLAPSAFAKAGIIPPKPINN
jgi:SPP1 gp7 family putative phage head morphogenesis protein